MKQDLTEIITYLRSEGFEVQNWKPGDKRIFQILHPRGSVGSVGMYSDELRAWYAGYVAGKKIGAPNGGVK